MAELPEDLALLVRHNAFELADNRWNEDVRRLITTLDRLVERSVVEEAPARDMSVERVVRLPARVRRLVDKLWGYQRE
jgi:hypothetical protein